ncbi:uncharacterized protein MONBRDRAFT_32569 [Monosiga brevicollis MX1]|uniref:SH2 domain-containing protein n=1 Tax=Monosiga brevicollis TaxID=81824 RepID=A9V0D6_MONBE|nr:uncharacterized protein MONBRDRAFT_32569 [Monosiga brevicollis MX1]EDQ88993.1 predicted protein [Monosiga brevicollis MX1]|eukprot:XP_001746098.1 hypothetical protein [Monosiga brevicollis MX1]
MAKRALLFFCLWAVCARAWLPPHVITMLGACAQCPVGKYKPTRGGVLENCLGCPAGQYSDTLGATSCKACPQNTYQGGSVNNAATVQCLPCPAGQEQFQTGQASCVNCAAGKFKANTEAAFCTICRTGYSVVDARTACRDNTPPVVTIFTPNPTYLQQFEPVPTLNYSAIDSSGDEVFVTSRGIVDNTVQGTYLVRLTATDISGNEAVVTWQVVIDDPDAPQISLIGASSITHEAGTPFSDPGATIFDNLQGDLTGRLESDARTTVNVNALGIYTVTYRMSGTDDQGLTATPISRLVEVIDTINPAIWIVGNDPLEVEAAVPYRDPGVVAIDSFEGNITAKVKTNLIVDTKVPSGYFYNLVYTVEDVSRNTNATTRTVVVRDTRPPVITIRGSNPVTHEAGVIYVDSSATALDANDGSLSVSSSGTVPWDSTKSVKSEHIITYTSSDAANNRATAERTVVLIDSPPTLTLAEPTEMRIPFGTIYREPGYGATDIRDGDLSSEVIVTNSSIINLEKAGRYELVYRVYDQLDSEARATRTIEVEDFELPEESFRARFTVEGTLNSLPSASELDSVLSAATNSFAFVVTRRLKTATNDDFNELPSSRVNLRRRRQSAGSRGGARQLLATEVIIEVVARRRTDFEYMDALTIINLVGDKEGASSLIGAEVKSAKSAAASSSSTSTEGGLIAGVVVSLLLLVLVLAGALLYRRRYLRSPIEIEKRKSVAKFNDPRKRTETTAMMHNPLFAQRIDNTMGSNASNHNYESPLDVGLPGRPTTASTTAGEDPFAAYSTEPVQMHQSSFGMVPMARDLRGYEQPNAPTDTYDQPRSADMLDDERPLDFTALLSATDDEPTGWDEDSDTDAPPRPPKAFGGHHISGAAAGSSAVDWGAPVVETLLAQAERQSAFMGPIGREETTAKLAPFEAGTYLLRYSSTTSTVVISFKTTSTKVKHFPIELKDGVLCVDKKEVDGVDSLEALLALLKVDDSFLGICITCMPTDPSAEIYQNKSSQETWYKGNITRGAAEQMLRNQPDGTFLVRKRDTDSYAISMIFDRKFSHHLLDVRPGAPVLINKAEGLSSTTLEDAIQELKSVMGPKLPCLLGAACP